MVNRILWFPFYLVLLIIVLLFLSSCGIVHKVFSKEKTHTERTLVQSTDSMVVRKEVASGELISENNVELKLGEARVNGVELEFSDSSSSNQVEVLTDVDGGSKVIARGKLKSVRTHRASSSSSVSSTHQFQKAQSSSSAIDSTSRRAAYNNTAVAGKI